MSKSVTGRCFCGAVHFEFSRPPLGARACWCRDCQYLASGNATINAIFSTDGFTCRGTLSEYVSKADSGSVMRRSFCPACGTQLFSQSDRRPELIVVRVGTLDDRAIGRPQGFIWTAWAPEWGYVDPALVNHAGQAPPPGSRS